MAAVAAVRVGKLVDLPQRDRRNRQDDELRDAHSRLDVERPLPVGVEKRDAHLPAVAGVDQARRVHDRDPVVRRETRARLHEARVAVRDRDCDAGTDRRALTRRQRYPLDGGEVEAGIAGVGLRREYGVGTEAADRQLDQADSRACDDSAIRNGAKRTASRRCSFARTKTPSGSSRRSSIGAPRS
jgi:hypothetical protein